MKQGADATEVAPAGPREVNRNTYVTIRIDDPAGVVRCVRSHEPFVSTGQMEAAFEDIFPVLDSLDRSRHSLLVDTRHVTGRNDPAFEAAMDRIRPRWLRGFRRVGVLVASVVGSLQLRRYAKQDTIERLITTDEAELLVYLTEAS